MGGTRQLALPQGKNTGRWDTNEKMRRQGQGCTADSIWGVSALFRWGGGKSPLPEITISLWEGEAGASAGEKHQGLSAGQKKDGKKEGWDTGVSVNSDAKWLEGHTALGDFLRW